MAERRRDRSRRIRRRAGGRAHRAGGRCASQRPASAAANNSASAALNAAGSSVGLLWPERGITNSAAVGTVRLRKMLPSRHGFVLVADDDQERHRKSLQVRRHVPERRPLGLHHRHGQRVTLRRMLDEHAEEFRIAARVLVFLRVAHRPVAIDGRGFGHGFFGEHFGVLRRDIAHLARAAGSGSEPQPQPAAVTEMQRCGWRMPTCSAV